MATDSAPTWEVTGQREDFGLNDAQQYVQGVTVTFRTSGGVQGTVFIPGNLYTAAYARQVINARAQEVVAVSSLTG
jgi:hypothetical protein